MIRPALVSFLILHWGCLVKPASQPQRTYQKLSCWNRNLSSFPADLNPWLNHLDVSNNIIREIGVVSLRFLQSMDISHNELHIIHEGAFENLVELHTLNLARNFLSQNSFENSKAFQHLYRLKALDLSLNNLDESNVELYLSNTSHLEHLTLSGNVLTKLTPDIFARSKNLRSIIAENNFISEIQKETFESLNRLTELNLARNNLVSICDFKLPQLKKLNLSRNTLEFFITQKSENIFQLEMLDLSYNNLLFFPILPPKNNLKHLNLKSNKIGILENQMWVLETLFTCNEITDLDDSGVKLFENIYSNLKETPLDDLDLSNNQFSSFPVEMCHYLVSLKSLNLSGNCLLNISDTEIKIYKQKGWSQQNFPSLQSLDLQNNQINYLSPGFLEALPNIERLILKRNYLKPCSTTDQMGAFESLRRNVSDDSHCISFRVLQTLKHLDLQENGIKLLSPYTFQHTSLVSLNLDGNEEMIMAKEALDGLQNTLQSLSLRRNQITSLNVSSKCLKVLRQLNVEDNSLNALPDTITCSPLRELDLRNNNFTNLEESVIRNMSVYLNTIYISGNVFNCCSVMWLKLLNEANVEVPDLDKAVCSIRKNNSIVTSFISSLSKQCSLEANTEGGETGLINIVLFVFYLTFTLIVLCVIIRCALRSLRTFRSNKVVSYQSGKDNQCLAVVPKSNVFETVN